MGASTESYVRRIDAFNNLRRVTGRWSLSFGDRGRGGVYWWTFDTLEPATYAEDPD